MPPASKSPKSPPQQPQPPQPRFKRQRPWTDRLVDLLPGWAAALVRSNQRQLLYVERQMRRRLYREYCAQIRDFEPVLRTRGRLVGELILDCIIGGEPSTSDGQDGTLDGSGGGGGSGGSGRSGGGRRRGARMVDALDPLVEPIISPFVDGLKQPIFAKVEEAEKVIKTSFVAAGVTCALQFGTIPLRVYPDISPKTARMVWDLAVARGCTHATCKFYRNEAKPAGGEGPPYALLQGQMNIAENAVSGEGAVEVSTGHVAFIPNTKEWFVAYGEHPEWGKSHVVVGQVNDWFAVDLLIQQRYKKFTHPEHGTVMRLLLNEVPFRISVKGDKTYTDAIGPLKD
eukprot:scaffold7.g3456.t1